MSHNVPWSEDEIKIIERLYPRPDISPNDIHEVLPDRTIEAIKSKALGIGLRKDYGKSIINYEKLKQFEL